MVGVSVLIISWVGILVARRYSDRRRIREYAESRGWKLLRTDWPGTASDGTTSDRVYNIDVAEADGSTKSLRCMTGALIGTHILDDSTNPLKIKFPRPSRGR